MKLLFTAILFILFTTTGYGQRVAKDTTVEKEALAIAEFGGAFSTDIKGGGSTYGFNVAVEFTPIENWLEIEIGASPTYADHIKALDLDLLFKKPWTLSRTTEIMLGIGPTYDRMNESGEVTNSFSGQVALDVMYWPLAKHQFGLYIEPGYEYGFSAGHEQSFGLSAGLLVAIP